MSHILAVPQSVKSKIKQQFSKPDEQLKEFVQYIYGILVCVLFRIPSLLPIQSFVILLSISLYIHELYRLCETINFATHALMRAVTTFTNYCKICCRDAC